MELQALLVIGGVGVAVVAVLLLMSLFSSSGTSYEEAIAQQRKATTELLALAENKNKPKKNTKKAIKKQAKKEKKESVVAATNSEVESEAPAESGVEDEPAPPKGHVEFSPPVVVDIGTKDAPPPVKIRKRGKDPKVKPILVNKEDPSCVSDPAATPAAIVNHFEQMHPKDEFELLQATFADKSQEKIVEAEVVEKKEPKAKAKAAKATAAKSLEPRDEGTRERRDSGDAPKEQRKAKKSEKKPEKPVEETVEVEETVPPLNAPQPADLTTDKLLRAVTSTPPNRKKKKQEVSVLALMAGDSSGVNVSELVRVVREAALSRTEIQILTDALLDKHHDPLPQHSDWTEGPNDPMQKLKKQLADKEKALADEIEASQALHAKLKELRTQLNAERARAASVVRAAEEGAAGARAERHTLQARLQRLLDDNHQLAQDKALLQSKLSAEGEAQAQRVQMEMHIQRLSDAEASLLGQVAALQAECGAHALEAGQARCDASAARDTAIMAQQHAQDMAHQLQEANRLCGELEQQRQIAVRGEQCARQELQDATAAMGKLQKEIERLSSLLEAAEAKANDVREDAYKQHKQLSSEVASLKQQVLERETELTELKQLKAAPAVNGVPSTDDLKSSSAEAVVGALRAEVEAAKEGAKQQSSQLAALTDQLAHYQHKNNELRTKNWKVMEALQAAERALHAKGAVPDPREAIAKAQEAHYTEVANVLRTVCPSIAPGSPAGKEWLQLFAENLKQEFNKRQTEKQELEKRITEQEKTAAEQEKKVAKHEQMVIEQNKRAIEQDNITEQNKRVKEQEMRVKEQEKMVIEREKRVIERENRLIEQEKRAAEQEKIVESVPAPESNERLAELEAQNEHLQGLVEKYKRVIDDTEGVLSRLQHNVTHEEQRWAQQLADTQRELNTLRHTTILQMQSKIESLEAQLAHAQPRHNHSFADNERLTQESLMAGKHNSEACNGPTQMEVADK